MDWQDVSENGNGDAMVRILGNDDPREVGKSGWIHGVAGRALAETPTPPQDAEMSEAVRRWCRTAPHTAVPPTGPLVALPAFALAIWLCVCMY
ncbi:hypothetical protein VCV18_008700 [Metarhizium anisopliae]